MRQLSHNSSDFHATFIKVGNMFVFCVFFMLPMIPQLKILNSLQNSSPGHTDRGAYDYIYIYK